MMINKYKINVKIRIQNIKYKMYENLIKKNLKIIIKVKYN